MERKVIQLAGKTLLVSLPSKWARSQRISKGDTVSVEESSSSLSISPLSAARKESFEISLDCPRDLARRKIDVAYKRGADEIRVNFKNREARAAIGEALELAMGFEIVSQEENSCTIRSIANAVDEEFDSILRRVFLTVLAMADEGLAAASSGKSARLEEIALYDTTVNRLTNFCKRVLNRKGFVRQEHTSLMYCIVWELERIADEYKLLCRALASEGKAAEKSAASLISLMKDTNIFFRDFYSMFYGFSEQKSIAFSERRRALSVKASSFAGKNPKNFAAARHLLNIIGSTHDIAGPFYAMTL